MTLHELEGFGVSRMTDGEMRDFLTNRGVGVLALPAEHEPYVVPMSFGFDGEDSLYFTYVTTDESRKERLSERGDDAAFLVFDAPSRFMWQSVLLSGAVSPVPESEWDDLGDALGNAWRPDLFEQNGLAADVTVYRFRIANRVGYKQNGLPPGFEPPQSEEST
ncbi:pyridoxamine 5'-phosphate oxidase family protein [Halomicrobium urmianum]|uniref:pyridoxamine 5'-phosphate oxidase family protein n=1 Tax=Halomicrobium urmianum TaxID=1586233 RepID=UPI001CD9DAA0|nr:pyridoxamine 5'-phosphate oxidase family protein [Halomicrobium urmianum]